MESKPIEARIIMGRIVARTQLLSLFRYPGGKTWLIPHIRLWLDDKPQDQIEFIEPFAGGAAAGLAVADENLARHVTLVEIDESIAAVWRVIINGDGDARCLAERITAFKMSEQSVEAELNCRPTTPEDAAFQTILRNRISRGGIIAPGAGRLKKGEDGRGLSSRWYPGTLSYRIARILEFRARISFLQGDGLQIIKEMADCATNVFFIDPPYTVSNNGAGRRLYTHSALDHEALFRLASRIQGDFLMTYDNHPEARSLASRHNFDLEEIKMRNAHHLLKTELLIGKDLSWLRRSNIADDSQPGV